jgi:hypothetical protein
MNSADVILPFLYLYFHDNNRVRLKPVASAPRAHAWAALSKRAGRFEKQ